ncbi:hypothetical protein ADK52_36765 [Streptomyces sp. WM6372]|uniref:hypothetical protein n=1 Tax=Streptomyces sp. WM6372 TaxID=1415555 RepID=UPI0006AF5FC3|nr:hypothetical protein [Streptomyces sp. WM6372]KOU14512.1 hypothetical protein ADK52_36765 [Streptomyces sp. WM6372]
MNRATHAAAAVITTALLAGCSAATSTPKAAPSGQTAAPAPAPSKAAADAAGAFAAISAAVPSAKLGGTVTAENDPNHFLGRPHQYTSKITFTDGRIPADQTEGNKPGDVELGGSIEMFPDAADAKARHDYIQTVTKGIPTLTEYDYLHGTTLVRVSRLLTPAQAADYEKAAAVLP